MFTFISDFHENRHNPLTTGNVASHQACVERVLERGEGKPGGFPAVRSGHNFPNLLRFEFRGGGSSVCQFALLKTRGKGII